MLISDDAARAVYIERNVSLTRSNGPADRVALQIGIAFMHFYTFRTPGTFRPHLTFLSPYMPFCPHSAAHWLRTGLIQLLLYSYNYLLLPYNKTNNMFLCYVELYMNNNAQESFSALCQRDTSFVHQV